MSCDDKGCGSALISFNFNQVGHNALLTNDDDDE